jgi:hypothetical protein
MNKVDYESMTRKELRDYLRVNRQDETGWEVFFDKLELETKDKRKYPFCATLEEFEQFLEENPEVKAKLS